MVELPKTEEELTSLIKSEVEKATETLVSKHNGAMAKMRTDYDNKIKELKAEQELGKEEYAKQKLQEQQQADQQELAELRAYKKGKSIEERLGKEKMPSYFKNDNRLLNASEEDFDKVIKEIKKEYEATLPKGNQNSTIVKTGGVELAKSSANTTDIANEKFAETLGQIIGR